MIRILFLCTGNSCRSQMAEGFARVLKSDCMMPFSAGTEVRGLDPRAVAVMAEIGVDISGQHSKSLDELRDPVSGELPVFDFVITVCGAAHENCPVFPGRTRVLHQGFEDPPALARGASTDEEALQHYRRVREEIRAFVMRMPEVLELHHSANGESLGGSA